MENVWSAFIALNGTRQSGFSANPISFQEIKAWCELHNETLRPWEVIAIRKLDEIFIRVNTDG